MTRSSRALRDHRPSSDLALAGTADLMEGMVAAYALIAHADGEAAPSERRRLLAMLRENPAMSVFSDEEIAGEIATHEANFRLDPELAQQIAREKLQPFGGNRRAAARIIAACRELIPADGVAHPSEYRTLLEIKAILDFEDAAPAASISVAAAQR